MAKSQTNHKLNSETEAVGLALLSLPSAVMQIRFWVIAAVGITLDLWSKQAVFDWLRNKPFNEISLIDGFLKFVIRENAGAAFSMASGQTTMLITVSAVALVVVAGLFLFGQIHSLLMQISLALFLAGIIGNLYDRIFNGGLVRDFIDVYYRSHHWPAFNVADSMLCVAVGLMIVANITSGFFQKPSHQQK